MLNGFNPQRKRDSDSQYFIPVMHYWHSLHRYYG